MAALNSLVLHCSRCRISSTCPRSGSSPLVPPPPADPRRPRALPSLCRIVGGYGMTPVDQSLLSEEGRARSAKDGPCLSVAEVPTYDEASGLVHPETITVFHQAISHPRAGSSVRPDAMITRSHVQDPPRRTRS